MLGFRMQSRTLFGSAGGARQMVPDRGGRALVSRLPHHDSGQLMRQPTGHNGQGYGAVSSPAGTALKTHPERTADLDLRRAPAELTAINEIPRVARAHVHPILVRSDTHQSELTCASTVHDPHRSMGWRVLPQRTVTGRAYSAQPCRRGGS